jgi:hypothetical protein
VETEIVLVEVSGVSILIYNLIILCRLFSKNSIKTSVFKKKCSFATHISIVLPQKRPLIYKEEWRD